MRYFSHKKVKQTAIYNGFFVWGDFFSLNFRFSQIIAQKETCRLIYVSSQLPNEKLSSFAVKISFAYKSLLSLFTTWLISPKDIPYHDDIIDNEFSVNRYVEEVPN